MRTLPAWLLAGLLISSLVPAQIIVDVRPIDVVISRPPIRPQRMQPLVIDKHTVNVKIEEGVATTTVKQTFRNPNNVALEGTYVFPLAEDAAIGAFSMMMGGKMVSGEVLEKQKAAQIYRDIVARSLDPALLEYVGRRLFQARVFPIPAMGSTDVEMTFSETLTRSASLLEYRYPFRTEGISPAPVGEAVVVMDVASRTPMRAVYSPSHKVDVVKKGDHEARISFEQKAYQADRDFVLAIGLGSDPIGATMLSHVETGGDGSFVLVLSPSIEVKAQKTIAKDVIFVADTSGSMAGEKMEQLRRALSFCLKSLNQADRFGLITFSTEPRMFSDKLRSVDAAAIEDALRYVAELKAAGGTNINEALTQALAIGGGEKERPVNVIFMTDGLPTVGITDVDAILKGVREKNKGGVRLFVFGIGHDLNPVLLDRLGEENRGSRDYVDEREDLEVKVSGFYEKISNPILADVKVSFEGLSVEEVYPKTLPDLFRGSQLLLTGRFKGEGEVKVKLSGKVDGAPAEHVFALKAGGSSKQPSIPRLWAVRKVGYLLDQIRLNGEQKELKDEVVRLGTKYGIVTPYTSFLVVEDTPAAGTPPRRRGETGMNPPRPGGGWAPGGAGGAGGRRQDGGGAESGLGLGDTARGGGGGAPAEAPAADEALKKMSEKASADRGAIGLGAGSGSGRAKSDADRKLEGEVDLVEQARNELKDKYFSDQVTLSKHLKQLRDAQAGGSNGALVKTVGDRTFVYRYGLYVESSILSLQPSALESRIKKVEAYSPEYFDLVAKAPQLASVLALGENVLFVDGDSIIQIVPKAAAPESRPSTGTETR
jgi:Ca-activated chloride channel family protein